MHGESKTHRMLRASVWMVAEIVSLDFDFTRTIFALGVRKLYTQNPRLDLLDKKKPR